MKNINKYVGRKIRLRRKELGFSGVQLANIIGMSQQQVSRYERGECSITLEGLFVLANALRYNDELFTVWKWIIVRKRWFIGKEKSKDVSFYMNII